MSSSRGRIPSELRSPRGAAGGAGRMWIPLLLSPLFALSPIAGCALAGRVRQAALPPPSAALEAPRVTFAEPDPPGGTAPTGTTAPIPAAAPSR